MCAQSIGSCGIAGPLVTNPEEVKRGPSQATDQRPGTGKASNKAVFLKKEGREREQKVISIRYK